MDINLNVNAVAGNLGGAASVSSAAMRSDSAVTLDTDKDASQGAIQTLHQAVESLQKLAQSSHRNLEFAIVVGSGQTVGKVVASDTGEVSFNPCTQLVAKNATFIGVLGVQNDQDSVAAARVMDRCRAVA